MTRTWAIRDIASIGKREAFGHIAHKDGHYWGAIPVDEYPAEKVARAEVYRRKRVESGLSLRAVADRLDMGHAAYARIERGMSEPDDWAAFERDALSPPTAAPTTLDTDKMPGED